MSNVPPLRPDDIALVAAWPARGDSPANIARELSVVLRAISAIEPGITGWKRQRAKAVAATDDLDTLTDFIERGAVKDSQRPPVHIKSSGYLRWLYPVGARGIEVMIAAGQISDRATSSCTVQITKRAPQFRTAAVAHSLMRAIVDAFDPVWASWTARPLSDRENNTADKRSLGYLNYGDPAQMFALDPNAEVHGRGAIAQLGDDPELGDPEVVLRHLRPPPDSPPILA